jgi:2-iminobutanoate/2-iminopropanoate deaminase
MKTHSQHLFPLLLVLALQACQTNEDRIRAIVREEMTSAMKRTPMLDAATVGPYSPAQRLGNFLFVSGQIGLNQATGTVDTKDIESESRQALNNLMMVLRNSGFDSTDVVSTTIYLTNIADYPKLNGVYSGFFIKGNYPARATVQVAALPKEAHVEISAIAYKSK